MLKKIGLFLVPVLLVSLVLFGYVYSSKPTITPKTEQLGVSVEKETLLFSVVVGEKETNYTITFNKGENMLEILTRLKKNNDQFNFTYQEAEFGVFVDEVNGRKADDNKNEFWSLEVNGKPSMYGVKDLTPANKDKVVFKLSTY